MNLIAIIVALIVERLIGHLPERTTPRVLANYMSATRKALPWEAFWRGPLAMYLLLALPLALTLWLQDVMAEPIPGLLLSCIILILCLGPRDLAEDVRRWLEAREAGNHETAIRLGRSLQQGPRRYSESDAPHRRSLLGSLFIQSHERLFGVLIWFVVLGPAGAVFYRVVSRVPRFLFDLDGDTPGVAHADTVHALAAWIPARVTAALYGLAGSLDDALGEYQRLRHQTNSGWRGHTWAVLAEVSSGSMQFENTDGGTELPASLDDAAREVLRMQFRALIILLAVIAMLAGGDILT